MNLIILTEADQIKNNIYRLTDNRAEHIRQVLKLDAGDTLAVGLLGGSAGQAVIETVSKDEIVLTLQEMAPILGPKTEIDLICALPRPATLRKVLFLSACTGIRSVYFIRSNRVEKSFYMSPWTEEKVYRKFLIEGLSQGKRTRLPEVSIHTRFLPFIEEELLKMKNELDGSAIKLLAEPGTEDGLESIYLKNYKNIIIALGPEGGWVDFEIEKFEKQGFKKFSIGSSILRVEHALGATLGQIEMLLRQRS